MSNAKLTFANLGALIGANKVPAPVVFNCANARKAVAYSAPMQIIKPHFNEERREIEVLGDDGNIRVCKVDRLPELEDGRMLWKKLQKALKSTDEFRFMTAGGNDTNRWFFDIEKAE